TTKVFASPRPPSKPSRADCNATRSSPSMKSSSNLNRSNGLGSRTIRVANQDEIITGDFPKNNVRQAVAVWMDRFLSRSVNRWTIQGWEKCFFAVAARLVGINTTLAVPPDPDL